MFLPLFFKSGLSCLIVGGGQVASHKIRILLEAQCRVTVVAPQLSGYAAEMLQTESIRWLAREYAAGDCGEYHLVIAATPSGDVNRRVSEEAKKRGIPVNVVDDPDLSTVIFPAIWRERSLAVAVSTGGAAPFMAAEIRTRIARYARGLGHWVETGRRFRRTVRKEISNAADKNALYRRFLDAGPPEPEQDPPDGLNLTGWLSWLDGRRDRT
jgi:uroporphyrin-III C-methyltransferase/precorrin-2 dehydrogenase/sirohydrochlorin ferrochelatase